MFMALVTSLGVLFYCRATSDILTNPLQQCFLFFIFVIIPGQYSSQVSVNRTIGPLVYIVKRGLQYSGTNYFSYFYCKT